ncbi:hypothetical protein A4D02_17205 [Niastella koreensis]|uniref:Uncharacterized protein n=2 Tax=Niastella koreensis TaxID=354356 RepID=G8TE61_NIAKG|nr:hypothetical protein [Niastella koreensis]AEV97252.1 hypothetical protein Niako_0873 [Niastella koreensis GR20-10]OQP39073.1 hypothetical protein A4D02_17205 [Niastella koreensis]
MDSYHRLKPFFLPLLFILLINCSHPPRRVDSAYYYWKTGDASDSERNFLKVQGIRKLYVRQLDVDWSDVQGAIPLNGTSIETLNYQLVKYDSFAVQMIPVVFITNKTFERISPGDIPQLAKRLVRRCLPSYDSVDIRYEENHYIDFHGGPIKPKEIQFDCDWTVKTSPAYFQFLKEVRKLTPDSITISATIRLHQYKYPDKTGVPPVNRGMLMVYNISDPKQYTPEQSIFDINKASAYFTQTKKYQLPLDIALPAWSWCLVFRDHQFYQIENGITESDLQQQAFLKPTGNHYYQVTQDTTYHDLFLRPGDEIKAEGVDDTQLQQAAQLAGKAVNTPDFTVTLFELSEQEINRYSHETLNQVYSSFR